MHAIESNLLQMNKIDVELLFFLEILIQNCLKVQELCKEKPSKILEILLF